MLRKIRTITAIAKYGSFNKAAEKLYISSPALLKQINSLEETLGFKLFERNNKGIRLTKAGSYFLKEIEPILTEYNDVVNQSRQIESETSEIIRLGVSQMTPATPLTDLWKSKSNLLPFVRLQLVPFENKPEVAKHTEKNFEREIDFVLGIFDERFLKERRCGGSLLSKEPLRIGVPPSHPLFAKERLEIEDLYDQELMLINEGWNVEMDVLRLNLLVHYPRIRIKNFAFYSTEAFNNSNKENRLIVSIDPWQHVDPFMATKVISWDFCVNFGFLHAPQPRLLVKKFIDTISQGQA